MIAIFDGHNDVLTKPDHGDFASGRSGGHLDLPRMRAAGLRGGIFAIFTPSPKPVEDTHPPSGKDGPSGSPAELEHDIAAGHATAAAGRLFALERAGALRVARGIADVDAAREDSGPPVAVLHLEGAEAIDPGLEALELWYAAGLRSIGPVWSRSNAFAHGVPFVFPSSPDTGPGLTDAGVGLVRRCAEMGILIDLSHMNEAGFWDVARLDVGPLVASHSGVHAISQGPRNLTDSQLDQIGASDGLVGIVFAPGFLRPDFANDLSTSLELIVEHARYVADRIGVEHVAIGSDFDGTAVPDAIGDVMGLPRLLDALAGSGFDEDEIEAIAWGNWRRVLAGWWGARGGAVTT
jgi:membrane dipeptidase